MLSYKLAWDSEMMEFFSVESNTFYLLESLCVEKKNYDLYLVKE